MSIAITEDHRSLAETVRSFAEKRDVRGAARARLESPDDSVAEFWSEVAGLGWLGLHLPEDVGGSGYGRRVSFGRDYVKGSLLECFEANRDQYPVLLPRLSEAPETRLAHLRLHNGTIWRWNRPLIGFDNNGTPHFRIEHRVIPAGPTITDMIANTALYFGAVTAMSRELGVDVGDRLNFDQARANFYAAARGGLDAEITWLDRERGTARDLLLERVLPQASEGLEMLGISSREAGHWLGIIEQRARTGRTGAWWQESWVRGHGADMRRLTEAYLSRQATDEPVHTWRAG